jgi:hypothetical protein
MKEVICEAWGIQLPPRPAADTDDDDAFDDWYEAVEVAWRPIAEYFGFC